MSGTVYHWGNVVAYIDMKGLSARVRVCAFLL